MSPTTRLAPRLAVARIKMRSGAAWLDVLAVVSFALSTLIALTVAGGIWMFKTLNDERPARIIRAIGEHNADAMLTYYLLSVVAGALLVIPIFALGSSAARLGAQARARRLATLRLIGVTGSQTVRMALVETAAQWLIGAVAGVVLYYATLPAWGNASFFKVSIDTSLMMLPIAAMLGLLAVLLFIAMASTVVGLQKVRISPLGVTRRETPKALKMWRLVLFIVAGLAFVYWSSSREGSRVETSALVSVGIFVGLFLAAFSLVGPWLLQVAARPLTKTSSVPRLLAVRRLLDDPRAVWRTVGGVALLCFVAGFVSAAPDSTNPGFEWALRDIKFGVWITLAFGFAVAAQSSLTNQASLVFERADQTIALSKVGFPFRVFTLSRLHQVLGPLAATSVIGAGLGCFLVISFMDETPSNAAFIQLAGVLGVGFALTLLALLVCTPLERHVLTSSRRRND